MSMDRRRFISRGGAIAATGAIGSLAANAAVADGIGPIEDGWREYVRREDALNNLGRDIKPEEDDWCLDAIKAAATHKPDGEREWIAMMVVSVHLTRMYDRPPINAALNAAEAVLSVDTKRDMWVR